MNLRVSSGHTTKYDLSEQRKRSEPNRVELTVWREAGRVERLETIRLTQAEALKLSAELIESVRLIHEVSQ